MNRSECRICFGVDYIDNMITPCRCRGTSKYVHRNCLNLWRALGINPRARSHCTICNFEYSIHIISQTKFNCFNYFCKNIGQNWFYLLIFYSIFAVSLSYIIYWINNSRWIICINNISLKVYQFVFFLLIFIFLFFFCLNFIFFRNKQLLCYHYVNEKLHYFLIVLIGTLICLYFSPWVGPPLSLLFFCNVSQIHFYTVNKIMQASSTHVISFTDNELAELNV